MASARRTGTNENISTFGNCTRDYTSVSLWEQDTDNNLVSLMQSEVLECYDDATSFADTNVTFFGAGTDASYFRIIRPAAGQGHDGTPNVGVFFDDIGNNNKFELQEAYFTLQDLVLKKAVNSSPSRVVVLHDALCFVVGCIFFDCLNAGLGTVRCIQSDFAADGGAIVDCLFHNSDIGLNWTSANAVSVYNCTATNCGVGFARTGGDVVAKNCLADGNGTDFSGTYASGSTTNASSDTTAPGTSPRISQTFTFVDAGGDDFHLSASDAGAKDFGTDLSADGAFAFDDDIDGDLFLTWDIGMDEPTPAVVETGETWPSRRAISLP